MIRLSHFSEFYFHFQTENLSEEKKDLLKEEAEAQAEKEAAEEKGGGDGAEVKAAEVTNDHGDNDIHEQGDANPKV